MLALLKQVAGLQRKGLEHGLGDAWEMGFGINIKEES